MLQLLDHSALLPGDSVRMARRKSGCDPNRMELSKEGKVGVNDREGEGRVRINKRWVRK